eukprot:symbB.v1.2.033047.t1/scaffold4052.1/size45522/1
MTTWRDESRFNAEGFYGELQRRLRQQQEVLGELQRRAEERLRRTEPRSAVWKDDGAVHGQVIGRNGQCTSG